MRLSTDKCNRQSIRLREYDYGSDGTYYITLCTKNKEYLFGTVVNNKMQLNEYGKIVEDEWMKTAKIRHNVYLDKHIVMPNHIHGVIIIDNGREGRGVLQYAPTNSLHSPSETIGSIIRGFKSAVTKQINILRETPQTPVWQRNYYEHVIRDDNDLNTTRQYIHNNPLNWDDDENNPMNIDKHLNLINNLETKGA